MDWLFLLLAMAVIALAVGVITGRISGSMGPPATSLPFQGLPDDVGPADLETLRFDAALRGYRMDQVDAVVTRLAVELRSRDEEIVRLRVALAGGQDACEPRTGEDACEPRTGQDACEPRTGQDACEPRSGEDATAGPDSPGGAASEDRNA